MNIFDINTHAEYLKHKGSIDINEQDSRFHNALIVALKKENLEKAKWLIDEGIKLKEEDESYKEVIYNNCKFSNRCMEYTKKHPEMQLYLIEKGLKIESAQHFMLCNIPLTFHAANVEILDKLLNLGHPVEMIQERTGNLSNILHHINATPELISYIVNHLNYNINETDYSNENSFIFYTKNLKEDDLKKYIMLGLDINQKNKYSRTALFGASFEKTKLLINENIDIQQIDIYGKNALGYVKDKQTAKFLIDCGINTKINNLFDNIHILGNDVDLYNFINTYIVGIEKKEIEKNMPLHKEKIKLKRL